MESAVCQGLPEDAVQEVEISASFAAAFTDFTDYIWKERWGQLTWHSKDLFHQNVNKESVVFIFDKLSCFFFFSIQ